MRAYVRARADYYRYFYNSLSSLLFPHLPHTLSKTTRHFPKNNTSFFRKRHVTFSKTTRHFSKNNTSLFQKQHVIFPKTTRHFSENNTSLFQKQHVIFPKTTRHFSEDNTSLFQKQHVVTTKIRVISSWHNPRYSPTLPTHFLTKNAVEKINLMV